MAKLTFREIWAVARDEPLYRVAALIFAVGAVVYVGVQLAPFWGVWRPYDKYPHPAVEGIYRIADDCFSFAALPTGWRPARQPMDGDLIRIERRTDGFRVIATLAPHLKEPPESKEDGEPGSDMYRLDGYTPRIFLGESLVFFSDGSRHQGRRVHCMDYDYPGWRPAVHECDAEDRGRPGKYTVYVLYRSGDARYADPLLDEAFTALASGLRTCSAEERGAPS